MFVKFLFLEIFPTNACFFLSSPRFFLISINFCDYYSLCKCIIYYSLLRFRSESMTAAMAMPKTLASTFKVSYVAAQKVTKWIWLEDITKEKIGSLFLSLMSCSNFIFHSETENYFFFSLNQKVISEQVEKNSLFFFGLCRKKNNKEEKSQCFQLQKA